MRIGDNLTYHPDVHFTDADRAAPDLIRDSFVPTTEAVHICSRLLERLSGIPDSLPGAFLITGPRGVGKTHILRYLGVLLRAPEDPACSSWASSFGNVPRPTTAMETLFVSGPGDPCIHLENHLAGKLGAAADSEQPSGDDALSRMALVNAVQKLKSTAVGCIVVDNVSPRIDRIHDRDLLEREIQTYEAVIEAAAASGLLIVLVGDQRHMGPDGAEASNQVPLASLRRSCEIIPLGSSNIAEVFAAAVATKDKDQRQAILEIYEQLRRKIPSFPAGAASFVDLYPILPGVFNALFPLCSMMPDLSPLRVAQESAALVLDRPAEKLFTVDDLFDFIFPHLLSLGQFGPLLASFEGFRSNVLPLFGPTVRPKIEALLKGIAFSTICEGRAADVRSLAAGLLLFEDSDFLPSHSLTSALLSEMDQKGGMHLLAEGEKLERRYRLLEVVSAHGTSLSREQLEREGEFRQNLPLLISDWIRSHVPEWKSEFRSSYESSSQSFIARIPEGDRRPAGLVYFKSVADPFWSEEDAQVLEGNRFAWILLVLSPLEHAYNTEPTVRELASRIGRILVWRPDRPSRKEIEELQEIASFHPAVVDVPPDPASAGEARHQADRVLGSLYLERGRFVSAGDEWPIGDEIENRSLAKYLSVHLAALTSHAGVGPSVTDARHALAHDIVADENEALRIASLLASRGPGDAIEPESARELVLAWWNRLLPIESALAQRKGRPIPNSILTTQFWSEFKSAGGHLQILRPLFQAFQRDEISLRTAMGELLRHFNGDERRLAAWRDSLQNLEGLIAWLPAFEAANDYLLEAFPLGHDALDSRRSSLIDRALRPHTLVHGSERATFDRDFLEFKNSYIDCYYSVHEEALNIVGVSREPERKVDGAALHNLELLSTLHYTDKSYLNRVRILGKWVLRNQCSLPVREILERYPRCYCNFNPAGNRELAESAAQINLLIQEGIERIRGALRKCSNFIISYLKASRVDSLHATQIASLLSRGQVGPLKPKTMQVLNKIIEQHSSDFLTAFRSEPLPPAPEAEVADEKQ